MKLLTTYQSTDFRYVGPEMPNTSLSTAIALQKSALQLNSCATGERHNTGTSSGESAYKI
jgi:hypothetical protein